ncbi:MAG TPA: YqgE/AlgH family protein [Tepidisphaeraceae bacterium]|nr:YqgE/AlgH family protein [Tepidisphaeraceae bacterium]
MSSLAGHFLVSLPQLTDPNFYQTIVLIVQHNDSGALGLILNRPSRASVGEVAEKLLESTTTAIAGQVHQGGPCDGPLMILHDEEAAADLTIMQGAYFTTDRTKLEWLLQKHDGEAIVFVGYSGWTAGQLEGELESNSWLVTPASIGEIFGPPLRWTTLITRALLGQYVPVERIPPEAGLN